MKTFKLQIAAPDGLRYDGEAVQLSVRGIGGELAILAGHIPFVTALRSGECRVYLEDGGIRRANCSGGMLMVSKECVRVLSSDFKWTEE
ncbi:MAG: F0F1 ATP synthase subunit epsilon [Clostridia bacterium]|nr:F0F1 ATP synthase subunit epsilon [Clostridia bacterium]